MPRNPSLVLFVVLLIVAVAGTVVLTRKSKKPGEGAAS